MVSGVYVRGNGQLINAAMLRQLRNDAGLSQAELSRLSGVGQSYISQLEVGTRKVVHPKTARKLAAALAEALERETRTVVITLPGRRLPVPTPATAGVGG